MHIDRLHTQDITEIVITENAKILLKHNIKGTSNEIEFKVTVTDDLDKRFGMAKLLADPAACRKLIEACLFDHVAKMLDDKRGLWMAQVEKTIDRRVESILNTTTKALETEIAYNIKKQLEARVAHFIRDYPIEVQMGLPPTAKADEKPASTPVA